MNILVLVTYTCRGIFEESMNMSEKLTNIVLFYESGNRKVNKIYEF